MKRIILTIIGILFFSGIFFSAKAQEKLIFTEKVKIPTGKIDNQHRTGTCWAFATASFLESEAIRKGKPEINISEMFFVNYAYRTKAEYFVRLRGNANFSEGGQAHDVLNVIRDYGIVTEDVYKGNTYSDTHDHSNIVEELSKIVKNATKEEIIEPDIWKNQILGILNKYFGEIPNEINFDTKNYTPKSFTTDYLEINPDDYIEFTSYTHHPFYTFFSLEVPDNWSHDMYYNLPIDSMMSVMDYALLTGYTIAWDGDVSNDGFKTKDAIAVLTEKDIKALDSMSIQDYRQRTFDNFVTTDDHLMHIVGIAYDQNNKKYYITKNSWGPYNQYGGYLYMSEEYVKLNTIAFMVHRDAITEKVENND